MPITTLSSTVGAASSSVVGGVNPAYTIWVQQDQAILSMIISSLSKKVMHLAVGRSMSKQVWNSIEKGLPSSSQARALRLLVNCNFSDKVMLWL